MKIAINTCYGGFSVSKAVYDEVGLEWDGWGNTFNDDRANPDLIAAIEKLGSEAASGLLACVEVIEIPDGADWVIEEYDGHEWVAEAHRTWP